MSKRTTFTCTVILFFATLTAIGYWMLFSNFAVFDDEGYILLSAREYWEQGKLYETVYSQYGPAFYVFLDGFQRLLNGAVDHTYARLLTLGFWVGTAVCCGGLVWNETRSRSLALFTSAATFLYLYFIIDEPFHPGSLIFFLLAVSVYVVTRAINAGRWKTAAALAGGIGATLLLTKINVGVFYLAGVIAWGMLQAVSGRFRCATASGVVIGLTLLAVALMHTLIRELWVHVYLVLFFTGAVTLTLATRGESIVNPRHAAWFVGMGGAWGVLVLAAVWSRGTSLSGLFEGVLLGPLRHPGNYSYPVDWRPGSLAVAVLSLILALALPWITRRFSSDAAYRLIVILRTITGTALLLGFALLMNFRAVGAIFSYVAPLIWIWVIPLKGVPQSAASAYTRSLIGFILLLQYLHAYPVGGSQESWGTFLFMPLAALGVGEVRQWLATQYSSSARTRRAWAIAGSVITIVVVAKLAAVAFVAQRKYFSQTALGLPGAAALHLPAAQQSQYRILSLNAAVHTDMLFSLPGMFSFNLWTGIPTPTEKNTTLWFTLLNHEEQEAIVETLEQAPRCGLIVQDALVELMRANRIPLEGRLWDYLQQNFRSAFQFDGFAFWVRAGRSIAPLHLATVSQWMNPASPTAPRQTEIQFCSIQDGTPISSIEIMDMNSGAPVLVLDGANAQIRGVAINRAGEAMAPSAALTWPVREKGLIRFSVRFDEGGLPRMPSSTLLYLKDAEGKSLGEIAVLANATP